MNYSEIYSASVLLTPGLHILTLRTTEDEGSINPPFIYNESFSVMATVGQAGYVVQQARQTISGTAPAGTFVQLFEGDRAIGGLMPSSQTGQWSEALLLNPGVHAFTLHETLPSGTVLVGDTTTLNYQPVMHFAPVVRQAGWLVEGERLLFPGLTGVTGTGTDTVTAVLAYDFSTSAPAGTLPPLLTINQYWNGLAPTPSQHVLDQGAHVVVLFADEPNHVKASDSSTDTIFSDIGKYGVVAFTGGAVLPQSDDDVKTTAADPRTFYIGTVLVDVVRHFTPEIFIDTPATAWNPRSQLVTGHVTLPAATAADPVNEPLRALLHSEITLYDSYDGLSLGNAMLDSSGDWQARVTLAGSGEHYVMARIVDPIGDVGDSAFTDAITVTSPHAAPAIRGDFTGEGHADILLAASNGALVLLEPSQTAAQAGSLVLSYNAGFLKPASLGYGIFGIDGIGDFDGDGRADLLVHQAINAQFQYQVLLSDPVAADHSVDLADQLGVINPIASSAVQRQVLGVADFNGDGLSDVLLRANDGSGNLELWLMAGLRPPLVIDVTGTATADKFSGVGDFNGDGMADVLWSDGAGKLSLWTFNNAIASDGSQVMALDTIQTLSAAAPAGWTLAGIGDFNGDGKSDIVWTAPDASNAGQTDVLVWLMDGAARVAQAVVGYTPAGGYNLLTAVGDYDGDGHADLQFRDAQGNLTIWYMNGLSVSHIAIVAPTQAVSDLLTIA